MTIEQKSKGINYTLYKPIIEKSIQERKTTEQLAVQLSCNYKTAWKYRNRYIKEMGEITEKKAISLRQDWTAKTLKDLELAEMVALKIIVEGKNPREQTNGIASLMQVKKELREFLESAGVIKKNPDTAIQVNTAITGTSVISQLKALYDEKKKLKAKEHAEITINP